MNERNNFSKTLLLMLIMTFVSYISNAQNQRSDIANTLAVYEGENEMGWAIGHYIIYPKSEENVNRAGVIDVSWTVNKLGEVENVKARIKKKNLPSEIGIARKLIEGKEVLEINKPVIDSLIYCIKLLKFIPAMKNGNAVSSKVSTSVEFILI